MTTQAESTSETSVNFYKTTERSIPENYTKICSAFNRNYSDFFWKQEISANPWSGIRM
jgi:hypothetical protein